MSAFYFPEHPANSEDHKKTSYALLNERANRVATALLKSGIGAGDHVALCAPNSGDWLAFYFGVIKIGAVAVTLSSQLKAEELALLVNHSRPRAIFTHNEKLGDFEKLRDEDCLTKVICPAGDLSFEKLLDAGQSVFKAVDAERKDTAAILYTGGTTGIPKGVMLSHENINAAINGVVHQERSTEYGKALCFLPFNHVFGQMHIMNATILSGGENVYSLEVEEVLYVYPDVQECAVIGMPDEEWGERVTAFILPKPGRTIDERELRDFLKAGLSAYKVPKRFFMVDDFPRSPAGKLLKRKLRESVQDGIED